MQADKTLGVASGSYSKYVAPRNDASLEPRSYDHWHVDLHEKWEVEFWMKHLDCDEQALRDAVFDVGARVGAVRAYLATKR